MSTQPMSVTMREKYESMIASRFEPLLAEARIFNQRKKEQILKEVKTEFGIYTIEAKIAAAELQLRELKSAIVDRAGSYNAHINVEVDKRLEKEDIVYSNLLSAKAKAIEDVWLAGAPEVVGLILEKIEKSLASFQEQVTSAKKVKQIKATKK